MNKNNEVFEMLDDAIIASDFLAENFLADGRYKVAETWGPEGLLYLAESSYALFSIYEVTGKKNYIDAVVSILEELRRVQKPSGGWALEIGKHGDGLEFKVTDEIRRITSELEDIPPTVAMLKVISDHHKLTGEPTYLEMGRKAFAFLMKHWDYDYGSFLEDPSHPILALRSNPKSYHLFSLLGVSAWKKHDSLKVEKILPYIVAFVKDVFESFDSNTMPLVFGLHSAILMDFSDDEYVNQVIKPKIESDLIYNKKFKIPDVPGAFGHRDGLRGIVKTEAHMRSAVGIAIAMKFFDLRMNTRLFRDSSMYADISEWIQSMRGENAYYEFERLLTGEKLGQGSPGQYLPIWWILGKI